MTQMTTTTTPTPAQLQRQTFKLRFDAHWMRAGAEFSARYAFSPGGCVKKRKAYARLARKEFKQAAALYAQAAVTCQAWLDVDNEKGVRWWYRFLPAAFQRKAEICAAEAKHSFAAAKLIK